MTELELYKFVQNKEIDWRDEKLILWIPFFDLKEFTQLIGCNYLSDGGIDASLQDSCISLELNDLCEDFDIEPENILKKDRCMCIIQKKF